MKDILKMIAVYVLLLALASACSKDRLQAGPMGPIGSPGLPCTVKQTVGGADINCPDGTNAFVANGDQGPQGVQGLPGQDITPVVPVQLCPNVTPTYASVFPEFALCIAGHLYGSFNNNMSYQYFSELPDGAYTSSGQGAACSLTITGCTITY